MRLAEALGVLREVDLWLRNATYSAAHVGTRDGRLFTVYFSRGDGGYDQIESLEEWGEIKRYLRLDERTG